MNRYFAAVAGALLLLVGSVHAQLTFVGATSTSSAAGIQFISPLTATAGGPAGGAITLKMNTDFNFAPVAGQDSFVYITAAQAFTVGPLPVQITGLSFTANAKWVNGGGTAADPVTGWQVFTNVYYGPPYLGITLQSPQLTGTQTGNGFTIVNGSESNTDPFVLANTQSYQLFLAAYTDLNATNLPAGGQPSMFTLEAGGISAFNGFQATLNWKTVPEPTLIALAPAMILLRRSRRA